MPIRNGNWLKRFLIWILQQLLPNANPDFDVQIVNVKTWLLKFYDEASTPLREIGINEDGNVIMKMPFKRNVGYWTDNNLAITEFKKQFNFKIITEREFEARWNEIS